eukprot:g47714.t1
MRGPSIACWSEAAEEFLRDCLESVDWSIFRNSAANQDEYATTVKVFISKCVEDCIPKKSICLFPDWKSWMNREIHCLLKAKHAVFKLDDPDLHRKSRHDLCNTIRDAKRQYRMKLETQTNHVL